MQNYAFDKIRSFALVGHGGHGKTMVAESIARLTGLNTRLGRVDDHSSLMDFEDEEHKRGGSIGTSFLSCEYEGYKIHVADTPGEGNFVHEARAALQGVNAAVIVIAATDGIEVSTEHVSGYAKAQGIPRVVFINKLDRDYAEHESVLGDLAEALGVQPVLLQLPIGKSETFRGVVDLVNRRALFYEGDGGMPTIGDIPADMAAEVESALEQMMEAVAMADDELVEQYLDAGELTEDQIRAGLHTGIENGTVCPVLLGCATKNIGIDQILSLARSMPHQGGMPPITGTLPGDPDSPVEVTGDPDAPFAALCIKTLIDPYSGQISVLKVMSGTLTGGNLTNARTEKHERVGTMFHLVGKEHKGVDQVVAGDIFAVAKLRDTQTGDTLYDDKQPVVLPYLAPPAPAIAFTITPRSRADVDKLKAGLTRLIAEDPALRQTFDEVTKEMVLSGMGTSHVQLSVDKLARKYGVGVDLGTPSIPYRETIHGSADVRYRHKKQTGGAGQFGEVAIRVRPAERGHGYEFVNAVVGGVIPSSLIPSVEKGVGDQLTKGVLAGFPCVDVMVELYDGKYHPVDSKDIAFQIAGRQAVKKAIMDARPVLLEPIYKVDVVVPGDMVGDIMGDMNSRRGRVLNMDTRGRYAVVRALVPLAEMLSYSPDLRSMTGGKGSYTMEFESYEQVPSHMQDKVGSSRVDLQACKLEYSIVSPK